MRSDMGKVLTERPRHNPNGRRPKGYKRKLQRYGIDYLSKESMTKPWRNGWGGKEFSDLLGPLYNFLLGCVGRKWDDVYSEIRERVNPNSLQQIHLLGHVEEFVNKDILVVKGVPYLHCERFESSNYYRKMYVDPTDGILKLAPTRKELKKKETKTYIWKDKERLSQYRWINGYWYEVQLAPLNYYTNKFTDKKTMIFVYDQVLKKTVYVSSEVYDLYGENYYTIWKKQLNKKQIKILLRGIK